jgi:hypothetical protein
MFHASRRTSASPTTRCDSCKDVAVGVVTFFAEARRRIRLLEQDHPVSSSSPTKGAATGSSSGADIYAEKEAQGPAYPPLPAHGEGRGRYDG